MKRRLRKRRLKIAAASISIGTLMADCEMMLRDAFVDATKGTVIQATSDLFDSIMPSIDNGGSGES